MKNKIYKISQHFADIDTKNTRLLFYALIIGLIVGLVGAFFRIILNYVEVFRNTLYGNAGNYGFLSWLWPVLFAITGISIALFLVRKFAPETSGSGVHEIEGALEEVRPMRWKRVLPIKFIASLFSLGSGLLLGREGPTIQLGANLGKMVKDILGHSDIENNPLVSAGADAVQVVSTLYKNGIEQIESILTDIARWMDSKDYKTLDDFRGKMSRQNISDPFAYRRAQYVDILMKSDEIFKIFPVK